MRNSILFYLLVFTAVMIYFPAASYAEATAAEGERLGKTCAGCHGTNGNTPGEYIGKIGGQNAGYMSKVLKEFAAGKRPKSVEMSIVSKGYTAEQLDSIALYYAAKAWMPTTEANDAAKAEAGKTLAGQSGCFDCHGTKGEGMDSYPRIGGQNRGYLYEVLKSYKAGDLEADEMAMVKDFSDEQLEDLANFISGLK